MISVTAARHSATRFGEIPPLWQSFKSLGQFLEGQLVFGKLLNLIWPAFMKIWQFFVLANGQILKT